MISEKEYQKQLNKIMKKVSFKKLYGRAHSFNPFYIQAVASPLSNRFTIFFANVYMHMAFSACFLLLQNEKPTGIPDTVTFYFSYNKFRKKNISSSSI